MVSQHTLLEAARCALTTIHYPEHRTLTADEPTAEPLPAALYRLAATAQALLASSGTSSRTTSSAGGSGHRQAAANPGGAVRDPGSNLAEPFSQGTAEVSNHVFSDCDVGAVARQQSEQDVYVTTRHHAAGYDPVWMLLFAVKVGCQLT